jgi:GNAT superfamily N-acetyltransferase
MTVDRHYEIVSHAELGDVAQQVYELASLCFAAYPGVLKPSEAHRAWYVRRPGMSAELSSAALCDGKLVANVFITCVEMRLGGQLLPVGLVDTVMTHPAHRQRGLAQVLLSRAIVGMAAAGLAASALYTLLDSMPYRFYQSLGYRLHAPVDYMARTQPAAASPADAGPVEAQPLAASDDEALRGYLNERFAGCDGYQPYDEALWAWRKRQRPATLPADHYALWDGGAPQAFATLCHAVVVAPPQRAGAGDTPCHIVVDWAISPELAQVRAADTLEALLAPVPAGEQVVMLSPRANAAEAAWLRARGFVAQGAEAGMVLPLDRRGARALAAAQVSSAPWYPIVETVIGV